MEEIAGEFGHQQDSKKSEIPIGNEMLAKHEAFEHLLALAPPTPLELSVELHNFDIWVKSRLRHVASKQPKVEYSQCSNHAAEQRWCYLMALFVPRSCLFGRRTLRTDKNRGIERHKHVCAVLWQPYDEQLDLDFIESLCSLAGLSHGLFADDEGGVGVGGQSWQGVGAELSGGGDGGVGGGVGCSEILEEELASTGIGYIMVLL